MSLRDGVPSHDWLRAWDEGTTPLILFFHYPLWAKSIIVLVVMESYIAARADISGKFGPLIKLHVLELV